MRTKRETVNVRQGNGNIDLPTPEGIAATWYFLKARCGNTHPHAAYPFGKMTLGAYTGGYPTGYGNNMPNTCGNARRFEGGVKGFSHIHVSGTGGINAYYNYALTSPVTGGLHPIDESLTESFAEPGYYSARLSSGVLFEGTVSRTVAYHRYTFSGEGAIQIDFANCGLLRGFGKRYYACPTLAKVERISPTRVRAHTVMQGIDLYFAAECESADGCTLWQNYKAVDGEELIPTELAERFGAAFSVKGTACLKMAISFVSCEAAERELDAASEPFDAVRESTAEVWEKYLGAIEIDTEDETLREIFYSNFYHTLLKPCRAFGESFLYEGGGEFYYDLATMWDMYKTVLPLIFTLYPEESEGIVETLLRIIEKQGRSPINITISENNDFPMQARMLAEHAFADHYYRGGKDKAARMLSATDKDLATHTDFLETGYCERYTHIVDISEALGAMAEIAGREGDAQRAEKYSALAALWVNAFDKSTGLMSERSPYYEGDYYNYSFRLQRNMDERIALCGKERFIKYLDEFFGYTRERAVQSLEPERDPTTPGYHSFEGYNNESDMESPFAYLYAGDHKKTCEIIRAGTRYMFTTGEGGIPGNNDSGGLTSLYIWNALGLYPVTGQDLMLVGSPSVNGATLKLANGKEFKITVFDNDSSHIYVKRVVLNGREITDYRFSATEMMQGGSLEIYMTK